MWETVCVGASDVANFIAGLYPEGRQLSQDEGRRGKIGGGKVLSPVLSHVALGRASG